MQLSEQELLGAIARGWCHEKNTSKTMDSDLAIAIADEILALDVPKPAKLEEFEQYLMQMAGISTAAMGYWKEGDNIHPDYDSTALRDVAKLYAKYDDLFKAAQQQAEPGADERAARWKENAKIPNGLGMVHDLWAAAQIKGPSDSITDSLERMNTILAAAHSGQRAGVAEPEGWREFITEVAQQKPEKPDHWSPCGQCQHNADRAQDLIAAAPTQQQEGGDV